MGSGIKKPVIIFIASLLVVVASVVVIRDIHLPDIPFLKSNKSEKEVEIKEVEITPENGKILLRFSDMDNLMTECCSPVIENVRSEKSNEAIRLSGQATFPFSSDFRSNIRLYAEEGRIVSEITGLTLGKIESPKILFDKLGPLIQKGLDNNINNKYTVKDVKIVSKGIEIILK